MPEMDYYGRHEVLHLSHVFSENVSQYLCEHEQIQNNPEWKKLADVAHQALFDLYQAIGKEHV